MRLDMRSCAPSTNTTAQGTARDTERDWEKRNGDGAWWANTLFLFSSESACARSESQLVGMRGRKGRRHLEQQQDQNSKKEPDGETKGGNGDSGPGCRRPCGRLSQLDKGPEEEEEETARHG